MEGHITTTYRLKVREVDKNLISKTNDLYGKLVYSYFQLLLVNKSNDSASKFEMLKYIEEQSKHFFSPEAYENSSPLYFRRAAANHAIGALKNITTKQKQFVKGELKFEPTIPKGFNVSAVLYKGQYKELSRNHIVVKLFDGERWDFHKLAFYGRRIPEDGILQSPRIELIKKQVVISIPVRCVVKDITPVKERINLKRKICSVVFPKESFFAVAVTNDGKYKYFYGSEEYRSKVHRLQGLIKKKKSLLGEKTDVKKQLDKILNLQNFYSHKISSEIIKYCLQEQLHIIVLKDISTMKYLRKEEPLYLRNKIVNQLEYKGFKNSILITRVRPNAAKHICSICNAKGVVLNKTFTCINGHKLNSYLNEATNNIFVCRHKFSK